jgi:hypothetical protein
MIRCTCVAAVVAAVGCENGDAAEAMAELHQLRLEVEYLRAQVSALHESAPRPAPGEAMRWVTFDCARHSVSNCNGVSVRLLPAFRDGEPSGIKVTAMQHAGLWYGCGVRSGDVVVQADSLTVRGLDDAPVALEACIAGKSLQVRRLGSLVTLSGRPLDDTDGGAQSEQAPNRHPSLGFLQD